MSQGPVAYNQKWQQLGSDPEISMAQANIAESEKMYGKFVPVMDEYGLWRVGKDSAVQLEADIQIDSDRQHQPPMSMAQSDPICSSAGCSQYKHKTTPRGYPIDYKVPNFGMDKDIAGSLANMPIAEKIVG